MSTTSIICLILAGVWIVTFIAVFWLAVHAEPISEEDDQTERLTELGLQARELDGIELFGYPEHWNR